MNRITAALLAVGSLVLVFGIVCAGLSMSTYNSTLSQEEGITAVYRDSMLEYDRFWKTVSEMAQVPEQYRDDFRDVMVAQLDARYEGKDPMLLFIEEQAGATLDATLYTRVQETIEAGRLSFTESQRTLNDRQRRYRTHIKSFPTNILVGWFGYPTELCTVGDCGEYDPQDDVDRDGLVTVMDYRIITSSRTLEVFQTGREDEPLNVFGNDGPTAAEAQED